VSVDVSDGDGGTGTGTKAVTVDNVAPTISTGVFSASTVECGANNVNLGINFTDPGVDTHKAEIDWNGDGDFTDAGDQSVDPYTTGNNIAHTFGVGPHTVKFRVVDSDGEASTTETRTVLVNYDVVGDGFLAPINNTGHGYNPSVFKYKSTIPVKLQILDCDGAVVSTLNPTVKMTYLNGSTPGVGEEETVSTANPTSGTTMRFTGAPDNIYIYNLNTKPLSDPTATYTLTVTIQTGQTVSTVIGLKN
jgi:hypothetical protein